MKSIQCSHCLCFPSSLMGSQPHHHQPQCWGFCFGGLYSRACPEPLCTAKEQTEMNAAPWILWLLVLYSGCYLHVKFCFVLTCLCVSFILYSLPSVLLHLVKVCYFLFLFWHSVILAQLIIFIGFCRVSLVSLSPAAHRLSLSHTVLPQLSAAGLQSEL